MLPNKWWHPVFKKRGITSAESKNTCFVLFITGSGNIFNIFLIQAANAALKYKKEEKILNEGNAEKVNWEISKSSPKYSTQVFILGESV